MNTTLASTLSTTPFPTLDPEKTEYDVVMIFLIFMFGCPVLCYLFAICCYKRHFLFKRREWRVIQTSSSEDELSRINNDYYNGA